MGAEVGVTTGASPERATVSDLGRAISFAGSLYRARLTTVGAGYLRRDPMALLQLAPGRRNPYNIYRQMRSVGPMFPTRLGNWATTSHRIANRVLRDRQFGVRPEGTGPIPQDDAFDLSFLAMNPPDHTRLRRLALPAFSPRQMAGYRPRIEAIAARLLDNALRKKNFDLVNDFAGPLPIAVITDLLGIPDAEAASFARIGAVIGSALDGVQSLSHAGRLMKANVELEQLFARLFELRRADPADDIVSAVVNAEGETIRPAEMLPFCVLLLVAGFETTVNLIGNGVLALLDHPEQWAALTSDPRALAPAAVEEALRFDAPVQRTARVSFRDTEIDGLPVRKDQIVVTLLGAANRDPDVFDRPDEFDLSRPSGVEHLSFSSGIHYCVGQPLARLEAAIAFESLAERAPHLHRAGRVRRRNATTIRGPICLPVAV